LTPDGSPIELVFGKNNNLTVNGSAAEIKSIDLNGWSDSANPIVITLNAAINPEFSILDKDKQYKYSDGTSVLSGDIEGGIVNFNISQDQTFGSDTSNPFSKIQNVSYPPGRVSLTLGCGYDDIQTARANSIATNFFSDQSIDDVIFKKEGQYISLSGKNKNINFVIQNSATMELTGENTGLINGYVGATLILSGDFTGEIHSDTLILSDANVKVGRGNVVSLLTAMGDNSITGPFWAYTIHIEKGASLIAEGGSSAGLIILFPESRLTINKGGSLRSANGENTGDGKVIANAGSTLGDIGSDTAMRVLLPKMPHYLEQYIMLIV
jgi:hypothetical protein